MKLTYTVLLDVDDLAQPQKDATPGQPLAEEIRVYLTSLLRQRLPVPVNDLRIWTKATPYARKRLTVERIEPTSSGQYRVVVTAPDSRTAVRTFASRNAAETWANKVDPLPLP
ncbi:MAG: hypothetical protein J2P24_14335 [Streptosporangiales bacterium]|nr:hypothetical protein [Streptosporangiales bacterium]